jgi:hypothetical protein
MRINNRRYVGLVILGGLLLAVLLAGTAQAHGYKPTTTTTTTLATTTTTQPTTTTLPTTTTTETTTAPGTEYFVSGYCATDQAGVSRPLADLDSSTRAEPFILNGQNVGVVAFGVDALFGLNTWSNGDTSGSFEISDEACAPAITTPPTETTTPPPTPPTTPPPADPTTIPTVPVPDDAPTPIPSSGAGTPETLPFTGPGEVGLLAVIAGALGLAGVTLLTWKGRDAQVDES